MIPMAGRCQLSLFVLPSAKYMTSVMILAAHRKFAYAEQLAMLARNKFPRDQLCMKSNSSRSFLGTSMRRNEPRASTPKGAQSISRL